MRHFNHHHRQFFEMFENPAEARARFYVYSLRRFYMSLIAFACLVPLLFGINYLNFHDRWWAVWPTLAMGIVLLMKGGRLLGWNLFWNDDWETRKVAEIMERKGK